ncbi:synphilin-1 [Callorhinchus milii]|uniref:synphilin-1 n=1 Tax=Callorhinchus milii TaxID=7868 RepID=UPI001C3FD8F0|nr:synphilin-1 [Callorhinchus milii]
MMDTPEYLDLDAIDFNDDINFGIPSAKNFSELYKKSDPQNEDRIGITFSSSNWPCGGTAPVSSGIKSKGTADVYSKFRPVKRVSPLKHQPENPESDTDTDQKELNEEYKKQDDPENTNQCSPLCHSNGQCFKIKDNGNSILLGELEHYDLDMDEILDVPYIKLNHLPSQIGGPVTKAASEKRFADVCSGTRGDASRICSAVKRENSPANLTQFCVLSPVNSLELRKVHAVVTDHHRHATGSLESLQAPDKCDPAHDVEIQSKDVTRRTSSLFVDSHAQKIGSTMPNSRPRTLPLQISMGNKLEEENTTRNWNNMGGPGEQSEEAKNVKSILNIVREGQISLLPHVTVDSLEKIHDDKGNNLLHIAASQGHLECLQHLTTLMAEDCLTERNNEKLTASALAVKQGQLECLRWLMNETEAIAELSPLNGYPALIHYAASYGQEKTLLWLLQYMQEQGISLDELDQYGNSAAHVASQHGHLSCLQTLVEYGANVTVQNQAGEKPSQSAERLGHTTCSRYLVVVETCMSLASQVVKLTKQLKEQTSERISLHDQLQHLLQAQTAPAEGSDSQSLSSSLSPETSKKQAQLLRDQKMAGGNPNGGAATYSTDRKSKTATRGTLKQKGEEADKILRQLLGEEISGNVSTQEKLSLEFQEGQEASVVTGSTRKVLRDKRELKLCRLRYSQRSSSESDTDSHFNEDQKNSPIKKVDKPRPQPIVEKEECTEKLHLMIKKHTSAVGRMFPFATKSSGSSDEQSCSPTAESYDCQHQIRSPVRTQSTEESPLPCTDSATQKTTNSPKSALKSPSSKSRTSQNLKLRVTFEDPVVEIEQTVIELDNGKGTKSEAMFPQSPYSIEMGDQWNRYVGHFQSPVEPINNNQNNNNSQAIHLIMTSTPNLPVNSIGRKPGSSKASLLTPTKVNTKTARPL